MLLTAGARCAFILLALSACVRGHNEHGFLMPDPAGIGFEPVPLNTSFSNLELSVHGAIPSYVNGTLYRGAPGWWPDGWWLDGLITLNSFKFEGSKVLYSMRYNADDAYNATVANMSAPAGRVATTDGTLPLPSNTSFPTGVMFHEVQGRLVGSTGVSNVNEIDPNSLAPVELPFKYDDDLGGPYLAPTHSVEVDGTIMHHLVHGVVHEGGEQPTQGYTVTAIKKGSRKRDIIARIDSPKDSSWQGKPSFQHQVSATSEYYVMLEAPCYYPNKATPVGEVAWDSWEWNGLAGTNVRLVDRKTGKSQTWPLSHNLFSIHHINAFRDPNSNSIVLDTIQLFPSMLPCSLAFTQTSISSLVKRWRLAGLGFSFAKPMRIRIPLDSPGKTIEPVRIGQLEGIEFPTIRYDDMNGKPYQYVYASQVLHASSGYYDALVKLDVNTGNYTTWTKEGHYPNEPIFVPDPNGKLEDEGVVITNVLDAHKNQSYLLVLDAITMTEIATAGPTPHAIPHGFHGRYYNGHTA